MVKNKVCKKLYLASAIAALAIAVPAYSAEYDIKEYSTGPDSLINHTPAINETDTLNIRKNLTADQNLPSYPSITINGNSHILDGIGTFNGFTTESDKTLTINNYLIKNTPTSLTNSGTTTLNAQKGITERSRKDDAGILIDADLRCRGLLIGVCQKKLSACRSKSCEKKDD